MKKWRRLACVAVPYDGGAVVFGGQAQYVITRTARGQGEVAAGQTFSHGGRVSLEGGTYYLWALCERPETVPWSLTPGVERVTTGETQERRQ
jgi:hypothetical protein